MTTKTAMDTPESSTVISTLIRPVPLCFFYHILLYGMTSTASPVNTPSAQVTTLTNGANATMGTPALRHRTLQDTRCNAPFF